MKFCDRLESTHLLFRSWVGRWEEPEEQARFSVRRILQKSGIAFADVERDLREVSSVHLEF